MSDTQSSSKKNVPLNSTDTLLDTSKPLPKRTKCLPGSNWFYTDVQYASVSLNGQPDSNMIVAECSVENDQLVRGNMVSGKLPDGKSIYDACLPYFPPFDLHTLGKAARASGHPEFKSIPVYSMPTGCTGEVPKPLCDSNNQVYDSQFQVCVSCRDPNVKPTINNNTPLSTNYVNNSISGNTNYQCKNKPVLSMDSSGTVVSQTCDSGETLSNGVCIINFNATQK
jgi:hypothetical protein